MFIPSFEILFQQQLMFREIINKRKNVQRKPDGHKYIPHENRIHLKRLAILITCLILVPLLISCTGKVESESNATTEELIENEIWNPFIILSREESKIVAAKSKKLYKGSDNRALLVGNVEVDFFSDEGDHISILYSDSARINEQNNNLYANGNVYVVSDSGYTLTTSELLWDNRYKMIIAEDSVMFTTTKGDTLYGVGFESDMDLEEWKIFRPFGIAQDGI